MRTLLLLSLLAMGSVAGTGNIDKEIKETAKALSEKKSKIESTSLSLKELGESIVDQQKNIRTLDGKLKNLTQSIETNKELLSQKEKEKEELLLKRKTSLDKRNALERELIEVIVSDLAYAEIVGAESSAANADDVVKKEFYAKLRTIILDQSRELKEEFYGYVLVVADLDKAIAKLGADIQELRDAKKDVAQLKRKKEEDLAKLNRETALYKRQLNTLMSEQESSRDLLDQLKLTKQQLIEKEREKQRQAAEERRRQEALAKAEPEEKSQPADTSGIRVKKLGSSYQDVTITHLGGTKVKAPIDDCTVTKQFGTYDDPVYRIKIHNDSVSLKPKSRDSIVRSVLGGKVIFAKDYNVLGKTVVIEHPGNILTFYSNLSTIAPGIQPGKKISSRTAVGRVDEELKFKVTKGTTLVNPLELIRI